MKRIQTRAITGMATVMLAVLTTACSTPGNGETAYAPSMSDASFGNAVRQAAIRQTVDPDAGSKYGNVPGDAGSAVHAVDQYNKSFETPRPAMNVLGIGGVGTGGN